MHHIQERLEYLIAWKTVGIKPLTGNPLHSTITSIFCNSNETDKVVVVALFIYMIIGQN